MIEAEATVAVQRVDGYLPSAEAEAETAAAAAADDDDDDGIPWAEVLPSGQAGNGNSYPTVEAASVTALPPDAATPGRSSREDAAYHYRDGPAVAGTLPTEKEMELKAEEEADASTEGETTRADAELIEAQQPHLDGPVVARKLPTETQVVVMKAEEEVDTLIEGVIIGDQPQNEGVDTSREGEVISDNSKIIGDQPLAKKIKKKKPKTPAEAQAERGEEVDMGWRGE